MPEIVTVTLRQEHDYRFAIHFSKSIPVLHGDEPPPLGEGTGPSPSQLLAAAVGNCLSDSLLFALRKFKQKPEPIETTVETTIGRNSDGRLRILNIDVKLTLGAVGAELEHLDRVLGQFEEFCTVSQSVRQGIPVTVTVFDKLGVRLK